MQPCLEDASGERGVPVPSAVLVTLFI